MTTKREIYLSGVVKTIVAGAFADLCNPTMRPENYDWNRFTPLVLDRIEAGLFIYTRMYNGSKTSEEDIKFAKEIAEWFSNDLVKRAGFIE